MLPERGSKQQQQQLSQKESRRPRSKRSVHESEMPKVAPKGTKHRPSSAALPAAVPHRPCRRAPPHPPPPQHPARRRMAAASSAVAPQSQRRASDTTLWRHACASPTLSMRALPARAPCERRLNTPFEPAGGSSYRPRPLQRGAQQRHHRWLYGCTPVIADRSRLCFPSMRSNSLGRRVYGSSVCWWTIRHESASVPPASTPSTDTLRGSGRACAVRHDGLA